MSAPTTHAARLLLFLDFDGVLHPLAKPAGEGRGRPYAGPWLIHAPLLTELLAPWINRIDIVIASTWAKSRPIEAIRALLPEAVAQRVVGTVWEQPGPPPTSRFEAIARWIAHAGEEGRAWIALDDDARGWPEPMRANLVWCRSTLDDPSVQAELLGRLVEALEVTDPLGAARDLPPSAVVGVATALLEWWNLDGTQSRRLLAISLEWDELPRSSAWPPASIEAARRLLGFHAALRVLFPGNPDLRRTWIHRRNAALGGESPLAVMLDGGWAGVERVAGLLRRHLSA